VGLDVLTGVGRASAEISSLRFDVGVNYRESQNGTASRCAVQWGVYFRPPPPPAFISPLHLGQRQDNNHCWTILAINNDIVLVGARHVEIRLFWKKFEISFRFPEIKSLAHCHSLNKISLLDPKKEHNERQ
jgi:hypothetical protein